MSAVTVVHRIWLDKPVLLELRLSDGVVIQIQWSCDYACKFINSWCGDSWVPVRGEETLLDEDELERLVDEVRAATIRDEEEKRAEYHEAGGDL